MEIDGVDGFTEPRPYTRELAGTAPEASGVHVVFDQKDNAVYVGETGDLRRRLREHVYGNRHTSVLSEQVSDEIAATGMSASGADVGDWLGRCTVAWKEAENPGELKTRLVSALHPRFNRRSVPERPRPSQAEIRWAPLVGWSSRFATSIDLKSVEREYKLVIAGHVSAAADALRDGNPEWLTLLRRSFGSPNNLTSYFLHGALLRWADAHPDKAATLLDALWDEDRSVHDAVDAFCALLPPEVSGPGTQANIASFLLAGRDPTSLPIYRQTVFRKAFDLTQWPHRPDASPADRYDNALEFLDQYATECRSAGITGIDDRLDAQGLLWSVLSGKAPDSWPADLVRQYHEFLEGPTVDELAGLVAEFRAEVAYPSGGREDRNAQRADLAAALTEDSLDDPDIIGLRRLAGAAYGSPGPQPGFYALLNSPTGVDQLTGMLRHLLYGPGDVAVRLNECLAGAYKLPRVGEAMLVKALAVIDPDRWFPCYVSQGEVGKRAILKRLGLDIPDTAVAAATAVATNDVIRSRLEPHFPGDPWGMQEFTWWLLHRDQPPRGTLADLAEELFLTTDFLERIMRLLDDKGQVVFYGPPGTGKTYVARKLADHIARGGGIVEKVQFHPSYAYEDFIEGYRPRLAAGQVTYEVVDGPLKRIAAEAQLRPDVTHVLLIDELNRGNVAKILGELLFLLEYRDEEIRLQYSDAPFSLPANLYLLATMNTADRSIALVDNALRRRFHFVPFFPDTEPIDQLLRTWLDHEHPDLAWIADVVDDANASLADRNIAIGPSHFMRPNLTEGLIRLAWESSVLPFLEEHFFADPEQLRRFDLDTLRQRSTAVGNPALVAVQEPVPDDQG